MIGATRQLTRLRLGLEVALTYVSVAGVRRARDVQGVLSELRDTPLTRVTKAPAVTDTNMRQLARATQRVLAMIPAETRCLNQSLVLSVLLARRGIASRIVIAVAAPASSFTAHAWVEVDGTALLPKGSGAQARLVEL